HRGADQRRAARPGAPVIAGVAIAVAVAISGWLVLTAVRARRETRPAERREGDVFPLPRGGLHLQIDGAAGAPPPALLHGCGGSIAWWARITPILQRRYRVISIDLLGHGSSEKHAGDYSTAALARQVGRALDKLGIDRAAVAGQSMGGLVAILLADIRPQLISRLVLLDAPLEYRFQQLNTVARVAFIPVLGPALRAVATERTLARGLSIVFAPGFPVPAELVRDSQRMTWRSFKQSDDGQDRLLQGTPSLRERVAALGIPVPVISAAAHRLWPIEAGEGYRGPDTGQGPRLEGAGHPPMIEAPEKTAKLIEAFASPPRGRRLNGTVTPRATGTAR